MPTFVVFDVPADQPIDPYLLTAVLHAAADAQTAVDEAHEYLGTQSGTTYALDFSNAVAFDVQVSRTLASVPVTDPLP